ncbi:MAG: hypothetical protein ACJZZ7_04065 [Cytophagales bacterium]|tara:strand:+ start:486 stop:659 length:174 start_codon:yes stop_codon:yes gene_type:complete
MSTPVPFSMFVIGFIVFVLYIIGYVYMIIKASSQQRDEFSKDTELSSYYNNKNNKEK